MKYNLLQWAKAPKALLNIKYETELAPSRQDDEYSTEYITEFLTFDIETTSTYEKSKKIAFMYIWQASIGEYVIYGRTWEEFKDFIEWIKQYFNLGLKDNTKRSMMVFVQNLAYEFQFIRKYFNWESVFALDERQPVKAKTIDGFEFRCTYTMSGKSLATMGNDLHNHEIKKLVGDLDYSLIRNSKTELSELELQYCINDVLVVRAYILEELEEVKHLYSLYLTNTGRVRKFCKQNTIYKNKKPNGYYKKIMSDLTIELEEYQLLKRAFQGGYTHANPFWVNADTLDDIDSKDFTSSYPTVMVAETFPMSKGRKVKIENLKQFKEYISKYHCVFQIKFDDLKIKDNVPDGYLSESKCKYEQGKVFNGRIFEAKKVYTCITQIDFQIIAKVYDFSKITIGTFYYYKKGYLPNDFVKCILYLYKQKTELKGVEGREVDYQRIKGMLNSFYGMCVTDILRDEIIYDTEWDKEEVRKNLEKCQEIINQYNDNKTRFLSYVWGVFVTAYARRNLWTGILECGNDYIYSDTDSIKLANLEAHREYFEKYNENILAKLKYACMRLKMPLDSIAPKTIKGESKPLGVWDDDGHYKHFKTLGAKRYMYEDEKGYHLTVAGTGKKSSMKYLEHLAKEKNCTPFDLFKGDLFIPAKYEDEDGDIKDGTGKNTHTYIDHAIDGDIVDYQGNKAHYHEESCIHLEPTEYNFTENIENLIAMAYNIKVSRSV